MSWGIDRHTYLCDARAYAKRGSDLPHAKLDESQVKAARAEYRPFCRTFGVPALARRYGVHRRTMEKIITRETWSHVF